MLLWLRGKELLPSRQHLLRRYCPLLLRKRMELRKAWRKEVRL